MCITACKARLTGSASASARKRTPLAQPGAPQVREYRIFGVINDVEIGLYNDVVVVTVS